jgi:hypothetical protein
VANDHSDTGSSGSAGLGGLSKLPLSLRHGSTGRWDSGQAPRATHFTASAFLGALPRLQAPRFYALLVGVAPGWRDDSWEVSVARSHHRGLRSFLQTPVRDVWLLQRSAPTFGLGEL